jgi:hypothetical protein
MKTTTAILAAACLTGSAFAGERVTKTYKAPEPTECFRAGEWQLDLFGQWTDGNAPDHAGPIRDHGWGGGVGVNYFFTRNWGIGIDGSWLAAEEPNYGLTLAGPVAPTTRRTAIHHYTSSLIYRFPIDSICLAPYIYAGGGVAVDGKQWAAGHAGVGVEKRLSHSVGIFTDGRWTYYGNRFGAGDQNNISVRVGVRVVF